MPENVTNRVLASGLCVGCGVCAGSCPGSCLEMAWSQGRYAVSRVGKCLEKCPSLCLRLCPFGCHVEPLDAVTRETFAGERGIQGHTLLGWTAGAFAGYSMIGGHRERGASGGMVTWMLERLMEEGDIDAAICVRPSQGKPQLFEMAVLSEVGAIRAAASTRYYPVEFSEVVRHILKEGRGRRFAVVGVSCVIQAIRRLMRQNGAARTRVRFLFGLVCEQCPSAYYTEALVKITGGRMREVCAADYRLKGSIPAWHFQFRARKTNGEWTPPVGTDETGPSFWHSKYFVPKACSFCDDIFAEAADAVFMDAWIPERLSDPLGNSIVVVRRAVLRELLQKGVDAKSCDVTEVPAEKVVESQSGNVRLKREDIRIQIAEAKRSQQWLPTLRQTENPCPDRESLLRVRSRNRAMWASQRGWRAASRLPRWGLPLFTLAVDAYAGGLLYGLRRARALLGLLLRRRKRAAR
jgi:coenzyme F420 hydrogenase subunit beta